MLFWYSTKVIGSRTTGYGSLFSKYVHLVYHAVRQVVSLTQIGRMEGCHLERRVQRQGPEGLPVVLQV